MTTESFRPPRWLRSPHVQTMGAAVGLFAPPRSHVVTNEETQRIPVAGLPAGATGFIHARTWWANGKAPAVVILHGIAGSKESHCCVRAAVAVQRSGYHAVRLDMRGAGDSVVDAPTLYHAGLTADLDTVVRHLARDPRVSGVFILGFSGGGSQALKLAGEWGATPPPSVRAIVTISAPLDYTRVSVTMDSPSRLPYRYYVLGGLLERARRFAEHHPHLTQYRVADLARIKRFRNFDESIIVPMHGFDDVDAYYREVSAGPHLPNVHVPTLILHAEDDPMVKIDTVRPWLGGASPNVCTKISRHGGHLGWLSGLDEESWTRTWPTARGLDFFAEHVAAEAETPAKVA